MELREIENDWLIARLVDRFDGEGRIVFESDFNDNAAYHVESQLAYGPEAGLTTIRSRVIEDVGRHGVQAPFYWRDEVDGSRVVRHRQGGGENSYTTTFIFDADNRVVEIEDAPRYPGDEATYVRCEYDGMGRPVSATFGAGEEPWQRRWLWSEGELTHIASGPSGRPAHRVRVEQVNHQLRIRDSDEDPTQVTTWTGDCFPVMFGRCAKANLPVPPHSRAD